MNLNHRKTLSDLRVFSFFAKTHLIIFILHSQKNFSKKFKKFQKTIVGTASFCPHKQGRRAKAPTNLEIRISSIPVHIRLDGATKILARGPVFTESDQQR